MHPVRQVLRKSLDAKCFVLQSPSMESNWATEHLQVIRTLMERSAVYRRALAPIMTFNGVLGILAAIGGVLARIDSPRFFIGYWMVVALLGWRALSCWSGGSR